MDSLLITSQTTSPQASDSEDEIEDVQQESFTPKNDKEPEKTEKNEIIDTKNYLRLLREAFDKANDNSGDSLTLEQWKKSSIYKFIHSGDLSPSEFERFFYKIDANANDFVSWDEVVSFLMKEMSSSKLLSKTDVAYFINKFPTREATRSQQHREMIIQILYSQRHDEYISLSSDSIHFWSAKNLSFTRIINDQMQYKAMVIVKSMNVLAVATSNRKLLFYELDSLRLLPVAIGASPSPKEIQKMPQGDARHFLKIIHKKDIPLYNAPYCICLCPTLMVDKKSKLTSDFFIGDDQGYIEGYSLVAPTVRQGSDFKISKFGKFHVHSDCVTQIEYIEPMLCYASSSLDHTVKIWKYDPFTKKLTVEHTFKDTQPILGLHFSKIQKVLLTFGISRDAYAWSSLTHKKMFKLGGHYNQIVGITNYHTTVDVDYIITMTNRKEFRVWDSVNFRMIREWTDPTPQRPENRYSAVFFDDSRNCLIAGSSYLSKWAEDVTLSADASTANTHIHQIVGCHYSDQFDQVITIDAKCYFSVWNVWNGSLAAQYQEKSSQEASKVSTTTLDWGKRRLYTMSTKNVCTLWNFNAGDPMGNPKISDSNSLTSVLTTFVISGRRLLARGGWDKSIALYVENGTENFDLYRKYLGHTADITALTSFAYGFVSGSANGEIFSWALDTSTPQAKCELPNGGAIECLCSTGKYIYCGDSYGNILTFSIPKLSLLACENAHKTCVSSSLSCIVACKKYLFTADTLGYVKQWELDPSSHQIKGLQIQKCAREEITNLDVCRNGEFFVTTALDMCARLWHSGDLKYVGIFNNLCKWNTEDPSTWSKREPFLKDAKHFHSPKQTALSRFQQAEKSSLELFNNLRVKSQVSLKKLKQQPSVKTIPQTLAEEPKNKAEEPFDIEKIGKTINEYVNTYTFDTEQTIATTERATTGLSVRPIQNPAELQLSSRPPDLIMKFDRLMKPKTAQAVSRDIKKRVLKIPPKKSSASDVYKIPVTLSL